MSKKNVELLKNDNLSKIHKYLDAKKYILIIATFTAIYLFWFVRLDLYLLFTNTILTGGDSASWTQTAEHLRNYLIPHGRVFGWSLANFFGYNELQHYFTVPFLVSSLLSVFVPINIAMKITTILGLIIMPVCFYFAVKKITKNVWFSCLGAILSLIFTFNESYTMYGGNLLSTLAGEFCYSYAISIFVLFIGFTYSTFTDNKSPLIAGLLLGLIGLCHMFVFMVAVFVPFFFTFVIDKKIGETFFKQNKETFKKIIYIYMYCFLIMAFWLVPMIFSRSYATPIAMTWAFDTFRQFLTYTFFSLILIGLFVNLAILFFLKKSIFSLLIFYLYAVCVFFYFVSSFLQIPDIRFVPTALVVSIFAIVFFLYSVSINYKEAKRNKAEIISFLAPFILLLIMITGISIDKIDILKPVGDVYKFPNNINEFVSRIPRYFTLTTPNSNNWFKWNYSGYESRPEYPNLEKIINQYKGDLNSGRIVWEKTNSRDNQDYGSERAYENLYMFTGRPSMEGVHYGSSFMARAITYMQSEYSLSPVDPEADRIYSKVNPEVWGFRFYQTNSKDMICFTDELKKMFSENPLFTKTGEFGKWSIFTYKDFPKSFISILDKDNVSILKESEGGFTSDFYRNFREYELMDYPFVPEKFSIGLEKFNIMKFTNYDEYRNKYFVIKDYDTWKQNIKYTSSVTNEVVDHFTIKFKTKEIGKPHIIKISYSPNFKSKNGEKIYPVSPGFMMIIPVTENVDIYYGYNIYEIIGFLLSLLLVPLLIFRKKIESIKIPALDILRIVAIVIFGIAIIFFFTDSILSSKKYNYQYKFFESEFQKGNYERLLKELESYTTKAKLEKYDNYVSFRYFMIKARTLKELGKKDEALKILYDLTNRYRHSRIEPEITGLINQILDIK